jgi:fucose permease
MFIQALVINLTPLLFIPLKEQFGLTYEQIGRLVLINFLTQMAVDLVCSALADRVNIKPLIVAANVLSGAGLWVFALAPGYLLAPYPGLVAGTIVFSVGCGLLEVLLSPIINAVPSERKASDMALLHAFYPIGKVAVIVVTALALYLLGADNWRGIALAWSVFPLLNTVGFLLVQPPRLAEEATRQPLRALLREPAYRALLLTIGLAGATELTLGQWSSAFLEKGLGLSKLTADLAGFCLFGVGMIAGRLWMGIKGERSDLYRVMTTSALLSAGMCLLLSLSPWPYLSVAACAPAGLFVSMLWPGSLSLAAARFPLAGASMFALMAAAGDTGAAFMPWAVGLVADGAFGDLTALRSFFGSGLSPEQIGLRTGLLATLTCPLLMALTLTDLRFSKQPGMAES